MKDETTKTKSPDDPEHLANITCDQCSHPKTFHRQKKYYCMAEIMYNDPVNNNEPVKAICSCTRFTNAEEDGKKKKEKEDKDKEKEKNKPPPATDVDSPKPNDKSDTKNPKKTSPSEIAPAISPDVGGIII